MEYADNIYTYICIYHNPVFYVASDQNLDSNSYTKLSSNDSSESSDKDSARNPITGMGLNGDGVGGLKPKVPKCRS